MAKYSIFIGTKEGFSEEIGKGNGSHDQIKLSLIAFATVSD